MTCCIMPNEPPEPHNRNNMIPNSDSSLEELKTTKANNIQRPVTSSYLKPSAITTADLNIEIIKYQNKMRLEIELNRNKVKVCREVRGLAALVKIRRDIDVLVNQYSAISKGKIKIEIQYIVQR